MNGAIDQEPTGTPDGDVGEEGRRPATDASASGTQKPAGSGLASVFRREAISAVAEPWGRPTAALSTPGVRRLWWTVVTVAAVAPIASGALLIRHTVRGLAVVRVNGMVAVSATASGTVERLDARVGDTLPSGVPLARIATGAEEGSAARWSVVRNPLRGTLESIDVSVGDTVWEGERVAAVRTGPLRLEATVLIPGRDRPWIAVGNEVVLEIVGRERLTYRGRLTNLRDGLVSGKVLAPFSGGDLTRLGLLGPADVALARATLLASGVDDASSLRRLEDGMVVHARVITGRARLWEVVCERLAGECLRPFR